MKPSAATPMMSEMRTAVIGAFIVALGPVSLALYTPAMPALVGAFNTTPAAINLTLTVYFFGFAFAQLVCGPLSDAFGRRPVAIGFFSIYLAGSLVAAWSPSIGWLLAGRALQGVGVAAGVAISRAIVRDQFTGQTSARIMNLIGLMLAVGPAVSPTLGGMTASAFGWHALFVIMVVYGLAVVLTLALATRETNLAPDRALARPARMLTSYGVLLYDRRFLRAGLVLGLTTGGLYTLASMLPFVMIDRVGLTPTGFGLSMLCQTGAYTIGTVIAGRLLRRFEASRLISAGLVFSLSAALWFAVGLRLLPPSFATVMVPVALWAFGIALVMPGVTTNALAGFPHIAGAAAAMTGFMQIGGGLVGSAVGAAFFSDPFVAMTTVLPLMGVLAVAAHTGLAPRPLRAAPPAAEDLMAAADPAGIVGTGAEEAMLLEEARPREPRTAREDART
ncbi:Bcr/CflA family drug resistance efflux transporter [Chelatococcus daeguensis]|uniref:Bcr/CflA family efflux transporter n=1 Tax=Chelatococcus daeguensis TaxID=444444 RepID=A0AAC9JPK0_9HYPH|nr:multidrug effflux MFS transporter [Chelatococcus daeguensis]APF35994.1 Bcr/CflA family drug resistance efflux transporter [Chelatococcus daeguensis]